MAVKAVDIMLVLCVIPVILQIAEGEGLWSRWYNSDNPRVNGIDNETVDRIWLIFRDLSCQPKDVVMAQCRRTGTNESFSGVTDIYDNTLLVPCNTTGLVCRDEDQNTTLDKKLCADYEIRVSCPFTGEVRYTAHSTSKPATSTASTPVDVIGSNGGFIAMAAGGSVVLPLVFVLCIQLRKTKREERRRREQERQAAEDLARADAAARAVDAPPAYEELFGCNRPPSATSQSLSSESETSTGSTEALLHNTSSASASSSTSTPVLASGNSNMASSFPYSSILTSLAVHSAARSNSNPAGSGVATISVSQSASVPDQSRRVSTESVHSASSTDALLRYSSRAQVIHEDPPPAYDDWTSGNSSPITVAPASSTTDTTATNTSVTTNSSVTTNNDSVTTNTPNRTSSPTHSSVSSDSGISVISIPDSNSSSPITSQRTQPQPQRRFLGMHLSIFDLMAVIYPDDTPTPPPSYDDALKILGVHKQAQIQIT